MFEALGTLVSSEALYISAFQFSVLFAFAGCGEWVAERAGTLNISIEGMLIGGAFGAVVGHQMTSSAIAGLLVGAFFGFLIGWFQANLSHRLTANQFVVGLALNVLVLGLTAFLDSSIGFDPARAEVIEVPVLVDIPLVGTALFGRPWPAYLIYPLVPLLWWAVFRTRWGLEVRSVGENPQAADVSGIHVNARRRQAIYITGVSAGIGGAFLVLGQVGSFQAGMVNGRGFIALAAVIFGGWTLRGTVIGCVLFGFVEAATISIPANGYSIDPFILEAAPYVVALTVVLAFATRVRQPRALAQPFIRGLT
ncbi:ABC transporter permease [Ilumatobacter nonamiensis]|uniref:ABC transporter permease n=1 Tax=Ilumatobacter nonamiensis TaxID=467093 RepID=UPI00034B791B|nr:ABC transporter permease [Ilumatobacter nonamiensis]